MALKVVKSAAHYTETALDEIKLLRCVSLARKDILETHALDYCLTYTLTQDSPFLVLSRILTGLFTHVVRDCVFTGQGQ